MQFNFGIPFRRKETANKYIFYKFCLEKCTIFFSSSLQTSSEAHNLIASAATAVSVASELLWGWVASCILKGNCLSGLNGSNYLAHNLEMWFPKSINMKWIQTVLARVWTPFFNFILCTVINAPTFPNPLYSLNTCKLGFVGKD